MPTIGEKHPDDPNRTWNGTAWHYNAKPGSEIKARVAEDSGTTKGKNLGARETGTSNAPKQEPGEDLASFSRRLREFRSARQAEKK